MDINDITKQIAQKYSGLSIEKKPEPPKHEVVMEPPRIMGGSFPKLWPSERMQMRNTSKEMVMPKRPPILIGEYDDNDLEFMLNTPVKRGWEFEDWLEVIDLPRDLHPKLDGAMYAYAARAFLKRKQEAHQR